MTTKFLQKLRAPRFVRECSTEALCVFALTLGTVAFGVAINALVLALFNAARTAGWL